jgi:hypothetical protein
MSSEGTKKLSRQSGHSVNYWSYKHHAPVFSFERQHNRLGKPGHSPNSPTQVTNILGGLTSYSYQRQVNLGWIVGNNSAKRGGAGNKWITVYSDEFGDIITAHPGR